MELKFGCVTTLGIIVGAWRDVVEQKQKYVLNPVRVMESTRLATEDELEEIIGRPIRLADVLLAFTNWAQTEWTTDAALDIPGKWNLRLDDLTLQDKPTIDFIHDLLK